MCMFDVQQNADSPSYTTYKAFYLHQELNYFCQQFNNWRRWWTIGKPTHLLPVTRSRLKSVLSSLTVIL